MITMRTKVIPLLTLFVLIILLPASSAFNNTTTSSEAPDYKHKSNWTQTTVPTEEAMQLNDTTATSPSLTLSTTVSCSSTTSQRDLPSAPVNNTTSLSISKLTLFVILLVIIVLMLCLGCCHAMWKRQSAQDSSVPRLLLGVRERLRARISNLEDWMGLHLWPEGKQEGEEEEEAGGRQGDAEEGGHQRDDGAEGGSTGARNEEKLEHNEEVSNSSDESFSIEGDNLRERTLSKWEEEEKEQSRSEDGEETSSASEAGQCAVKVESNGDKGGGSEEIALVNSPKEDDEKADLTNVTIQ